MCCLLTGCGTIFRPESKYVTDTRFASTRCDFDYLHRYFTPSGNGTWDPIAGCWLLTPVTVIDLPFALVIDTFCYPIDAKDYRKAMTDKMFWRQAFQTGSIDAEEVPRHLTWNTQEQIRQMLVSNKEKISTLVRDTIFEVAISNGFCQIAVELSCCTALSAGQCRTLFKWQQTQSSGYSSEVKHNLARNPATPPDILISLSEISANLRAVIAENPKTPIDLLIKYSDDNDRYVLLNLARNPRVPDDVLIKLMKNPDTAIQREAETVLKTRNEQNKAVDSYGAP